ncbi:MAG: iron ABC transporter permease [Planctomycetes bacterium]|nr:iron ABC transporter permease [Planctomycetota bacterium]
MAFGWRLAMVMPLSLVVYAAASHALLLAGVALAALCSALTTLMLALASERWDLGLKVVRWLMGSFEGRSWDHLAGALAPAALGLLAGAWLRRDLDTLQLGADTARSLGVRLERVQLLTILSAAILVGTSTAVAGVIGFVGLIVPHVVRMLAGPGHRRLLPLSGLLGASLVVLVDTGSRAFGDRSLPPGVITSLLGAPFFLWILRRHGRRLDHLDR